MLKHFFEDVAAIKERDPAATNSLLSAFLNYPGMRAIWAYRRHHWLWNHGFKGLARYLATRSRRKFGVEIHPGATIGRRFVIDHGMGVVIGETTIIGDDCMLYQGVTLGGTGKEIGKRHPTLKNRVMVGVGAKVLGNITLEDDVKVGGGAVVVKDTPAGCTVIGVPGHIVTTSGKRVHTPEQKLNLKTEAEAKAEVTRRANVDRREYLPDPVDESVHEAERRIAALTKRIEELEACLDEVEKRSPCGKKGLNNESLKAEELGQEGLK